jgi:hypothetical protein
MTVEAQLQGVLSSLSDVPFAHRPIVKAVNELFLLYLRIAYLKPEDIVPPLRASFDSEPWNAAGWDASVIAVVPFLPSVRQGIDTGPEITKGAFGTELWNASFVENGRQLGGMLEPDDSLSSHMLPLTNAGQTGTDEVRHWFYDAKTGAIRAWNYENDDYNFESLPAVPVEAKFEELFRKLQMLDWVPWQHVLWFPPIPGLIKQKKTYMDSDSACADANLSIAVSKLYKRHGWYSNFRDNEFKKEKEIWEAERAEIFDRLDYNDAVTEYQKIVKDKAGPDALS